jgi:hypothetical protein
MARRNANLAGLAALGALGYALSKGKDGKNMAPVEEKSTLTDLRDQEDVDLGRSMTSMAKSAEADASDLEIEKNVGLGGTKVPSAPKSATRSMAPKKAAPKMMSRDEEAKIRATGGPRGVRYSETDTGDETSRLAARAPKTSKAMTLDERVAQIPSDKGKYAPVSGEKIDSSEAGRNASNIMNATAGLSVPGYVGKMTQAGYNARAAARRAAGDLTEAEIAAAKAAQQAKREDKTLNPNAWMAGPKGMAENFKKGGAVKAKPAKAAKPAAKGWGQARGARGAKYY